jgi:plasmid stability protein
MAQMSWRSSDELAERVRLAAKANGRSMNDYVTAVLDAATNPDLAGDQAEALRARLARAGLLAPAGRPRARPSRSEVEQAAAAASGGTSVSSLVEQGR